MNDALASLFIYSSLLLVIVGFGFILKQLKQGTS